MLKTSTGKLYTLLSACKPDNAKVKKRLLITEILEMPEYKALQVYQGAASTMDDYYCPDKLMNATYEELTQIRHIIPFLEDLIRKLYSVICYGDVRKLLKIKNINYYDSDSMKEAYEIIKKQKQSGINITNIQEYDVWRVLDSNTITSIDSQLDLFDAQDIDLLEVAIAEKLKDEQYCISAVEIAEKRNAFRDIYRKEETLRVRLQIVENKIFVKKVLVTLISIAIIMNQFTNSNVALGSIVRGIFILLYIISIIAYWIVG